MTTIVQSIGLKGMEGYRVQVEVQLMLGVAKKQCTSYVDILYHLSTAGV